MREPSVAEKANLSPNQWHRLGLMLLFFGLCSGVALGVCGTLLVIELTRR